MSKKIKSIERKWIDNFKKSPLVDKANGVYQSGYAYQLFYGKQNDSYPPSFPHGFLHLYNSYSDMDRDVAIEKVTVYLAFIGIRIRKEAILNHLEKFPDDFKKLTKKCYYIFKTLAH
ncbi:MAG TPA: hypothetical protein VI603_10510, partial [Saprospiraceae bacterium]|nr:hypothetical protein [Saprospiraceae bacterium]